MSVLDALRSLLGGGGKKTLPLVLAEGEVETARAVASFRPGGLTSVGGDLVLTNKRLAFTPLDVTGTDGARSHARRHPGSVERHVT